MLRHLFTGLMAGLVFAAPAAAQEGTGGTVTGRVADELNGAPIAAAQVVIVGTALAARADAQGQYTLRGVPAGTHTVRALRVGYAEASQSVTVANGETVTADIRMRAVSIQLTPVVSTATGEQRRVEVGNAITTISAEQIVQNQQIANMGDLLTARAPGVQVLPPNSTGAGARVRIRGRSSLSLTNDPIYIIDGVRMESSSRSTSISVGGTEPDRVSDINPEDIQSIEIVKGPSAATLYGTDAANGVIVIQTKRGQVGRPQWSFYTEQGTVDDNNDWPTNYTSYGTNTAAPNAVRRNCFLYLEANATCNRDSVLTFNPAKTDDVSPLGTGRRQQYGLQVRGGSEAIRYFVSGEYEDETGAQRIPPLERQRLLSEGVVIRPEWNRPNGLTRASGRANLDVRLAENANIAVNAGYISSDIRLPQSDNNVTGWGPTLYGGPGDYDPSDHLSAYGFFGPGDLYQETVRQNVDRFIGSLNSNYTPLTWLTLRGNFGVDFTSRVDTDLCRFSNCADFGTTRQGFKEDNRTGFYVYTTDVAGTATVQPLEWLNLRTTLGGQFYRRLFDRNGAWGEQLPPGAVSVAYGAIKDADEVTDETRTLGAYLEEAIGVRDRLFLTLAVRSDRNSAFGADFETVFYPKASLSWVISQEGFFPEAGWVDQLRIRSAYGTSGVQPGTIDAARYFASNVVAIDGQEFSGVYFRAPGNSALKPERTTEFEAGIDGNFFTNRLNVELTYYNKLSDDALIRRVLPGSFGIGTLADSSTRFENLGQVKNYGFEALISAQILQRAAFGWDFTVNGSTNKNKLVTLGEGIPDIVGTYNRQVPGYPLSGYWQRPFTYSDANSDGLIAPSEVSVSADPVFVGYEQPRTEISFTNGFDLLDRALRISAQFDYKGGHKLLNLTERYRCISFSNCRGLNDPNASLFEQARAVAARTGTTRTEAGYIEDADYIRFRELSVTYSLPQTFADRYLRASRASLSLAARNLALWSDYTGVDPEMNAGQLDIQNEFLTQPPQRYMSLRLNLGF
jgi:TonB-linked SusC/RagA family outer membrane protein